MFDFNKNDDPTGPSDHIRTTLDFLDNNIKMLKKLSEKVQVNCAKTNLSVYSFIFFITVRNKKQTFFE